MIEYLLFLYSWDYLFADKSTTLATFINTNE